MTRTITTTGVNCRALFAARDTWDLTSKLTSVERNGLRRVDAWRPYATDWTLELEHDLERLLTPIDAVIRIEGGAETGRWEIRRLILHFVLKFRAPVGLWDRARWVEVIGAGSKTAQQGLIRVAYIAGNQHDVHRSFRRVNRRHIVQALFGADEVATSLARVEKQFEMIGGATSGSTSVLVAALFELMFQTGSGSLDALAGVTLDLTNFSEDNHWISSALEHLSRVLAGAGIPDVQSLAPARTAQAWLNRTTTARADVSPQWAQWTTRWWETSPLSKSSRAGVYYTLLKIGRWLQETHPEITSPEQWTRTIAAEWVGAVVRMNVGAYSHAPSTFRYAAQVGKPLSAATRSQHISLMARFLRDCVDFGWITLNYDPHRVLRTPRSISALIGPDPRVVADDIWAKLLWAGLNLTGDDLPIHGHRSNKFDSNGAPWYPLEMVRALAMLWLFTGLRSNEIHRLRTGCARLQTPQSTEPQTSHNGSDNNAQMVCLLDIPVTKTSTAFTKPVDPIVGEAINAWQQLRPPQPRFIDQRTGEMVDMLFAFRGRRVSLVYLNRVLIPLLCRKANVPVADARGTITSHRARATIATSLYNAKDPMTLFELQAWLGHASPESTQQYARISPITLTKAYTDAGYFGRTLRTIEVVIDREAIRNGTAATGTPWEYFDLGHGWCTYNFFEQCQHRMACARCDFYIPKQSSGAQLLEANANLTRMLIEIPLTDDERAAVEEGQNAMTALLERLADTPTPAGPTPRALTNPVSVAMPTLKRTNQK
jgi:integrase